MVESSRVSIQGKVLLLGASTMSQAWGLQWRQTACGVEAPQPQGAELGVEAQLQLTQNVQKNRL